MPTSEIDTLKLAEQTLESSIAPEYALTLAREVIHLSTALKGNAEGVPEEPVGLINYSTDPNVTILIRYAAALRTYALKTPAAPSGEPASELVGMPEEPQRYTLGFDRGISGRKIEESPYGHLVQYSAYMALRAYAETLASAAPSGEGVMGSVASAGEMILPPIKDNTILELKVPFKKPVPEDRVLLVEYQPCFHGPFIVDTEKAEVVCKKCNEKLNPMYVLGRLATTERKWHESFARYQEEMKRLSERSKTKCQHCKQMTRISNK